MNPPTHVALHDAPTCAVRAVQGRDVGRVPPKTEGAPTALKLLICDTDPRTSHAFRGYPVTLTTAKTAARATPLLADADALVVEYGLAGTPALIDAAVTAHVPVLVVSSLPADTYLSLAYERGADDWIAKPFGAAEVLARIQAIQRRHGWTQRSPYRHVVEWGGIAFDRRARLVTVGETMVHLSPLEATVFATLILAGGQVVPFEHIDHIFRGHLLPEAGRRAWVMYLRRKFQKVGWDDVIEGVGTEGYCLRAVTERTAGPDGVSPLDPTAHAADLGEARALREIIAYLVFARLRPYYGFGFKKGGRKDIDDQWRGIGSVQQARFHAVADEIVEVMARPGCDEYRGLVGACGDRDDGDGRVT